MFANTNKFVVYNIDVWPFVRFFNWDTASSKISVFNSTMPLKFTDKIMNSTIKIFFMNKTFGDV